VQFSAFVFTRVFNASSESYFDFYNKMNQALISCYVKKRESKCVALKSRPRNYEILDFAVSLQVKLIE